MKECTFTPKSAKKPRQGRKSARQGKQVVERLYDWKKERDQKVVKSLI
jgi:hypothetical protein